MLRFTLFSLLLTMTVSAKDVVPVGPDGKSTLIFEKEGYVYLRECPPYKIIDSRKDCTAKEERKLMTIAELRNSIEELKLRTLESSKDPRLKDGILLFQKDGILLNETKKNEYQKELDDIIKYKEKFGDKAINIERLSELKKVLELSKKPSTI